MLLVATVVFIMGVAVVFVPLIIAVVVVVVIAVVTFVGCIGGVVVVGVVVVVVVVFVVVFILLNIARYVLTQKKVPFFQVCVFKCFQSVFVFVQTRV